MTINIDPIEGLVKYVEEVKPFHTKIIEVLVEYIHTECIDVTVKEDHHILTDVVLYDDGSTSVLDNNHIQVDLLPVDYIHAYNLENTDTCGFGAIPWGSPWDCTANEGYHGAPNSPVSVDLANNTFIIQGGNYAHRFIQSLTFEGYDSISKVGEWGVRTFTINGVTSSTMSIVGDYTGIFTNGRTFYVDQTLTNTGWFTIVSSSYDGFNTTITVSETVNDLSFATDHGIILGAIYDPNTPNNPTTIVVPPAAQIVDASVIWISYQWIGPLYMKVDLLPVELSNTTITENLDSVNDLITVPQLFTIINTDAAADTFTIHYETISGLAVDLTDIFYPLSTFRVTGSFNSINNATWTVSNAVFDGTDMIITTVEDITDQTVPLGNIVRENSTASTLAQASVLERYTFDWVLQEWFSHMIIGVNQGLQQFTVPGDAVADIPTGQNINISASPANNGSYTVIGSVYDLTNTIVSVAESITDPTVGGWIISPDTLNANNKTFMLNEFIGVSIIEDTEGAILQTGGSIMNSFDYNGWDVGGLDETLATVVTLYDGTF